jgi:hypothetical protein
MFMNFSARIVLERLAPPIIACVLAAASAAAQSPPRPVAEASANQDPAPPVAPEVVSRGANGRTVVRATRLATPLRIDGQLDEEIYSTLKSLTDFIQAVPNEGEVSTERTEAWVMFDDDFIYITGRLWDTAPPDKWVANELRRDTSQLRQNDSFGVLLDTFHDRRNGYHFYTNPLGGFADQIVTDEGNPNVDWNPVWQVRTGRFEGGWTAELAIPFKSIRYVSGENQTWGLQLRRSIRRKNEWTHLTALPPQGGGSNSIFRVSRAATLIGLDLPPASKNLELKPYAIDRVTSDRTRDIDNDNDPDFGIDAKYGVTANLTADITYNTDFAQVEVDEQQVNLTRFQLQFPEKRDFFLEGRGIFDFGRTSGGPGNGNATPTAGAPSLFYSRRIGLSGGAVIPIDVGGRLTGKAGKYSIGLLNLQTDEEAASKTPTTNFTVVRLKRDVLRRSSIGMMVTNRSESVVDPGGSNLAYGVDALFSLFQDLNLGAYWARSVTDGREKDRDSYTAKFDYAGDRYGAKVEYLKVGDNFNPEVGFVRRDNFGRTFSTLRFSPRPKGRNIVRRYSYEGTFEYLENGAGVLESREQGARFSAEFQNSDVLTVQANRTYELLLNNFTVSGVTIPRGGYTYTDQTTSYQFGQQRPISGTASLQVGHFYNGDITAVGFSGGRVAILKQWSAEPSVSVNRVTLPSGDFTQTVLRTRTDYGFSPRMFMSGLVQWSATDHLLSSNFRFRWEYAPGSELFVVYTDERDSMRRTGYPDLKNRAFVVKINRLFRF